MELRELAERVNRMRKTVRAVELLYESGVVTALTVARGRPQPEPPQFREDLGVRLWLDDGRTGFRSGRPEDVDALVAQAIDDAERAAADPHAGPVSRQTGLLSGLGIADRRHDGLAEFDRVEVLVAAEKSVRTTDRRVAPCRFRYVDELRTRRFTSSRGVALEEVDTTYALSGAVTTTAGGDELQIEATIESRSFASIASIPLGTALAVRAAELSAGGETVDGPVRVVLPPVAVARLFGTLASRFSVEDFEGDGWFLRPRPDGAPAVSPRLHLQDDGAMPGGLRTASFDDRGVAPVPLTLLREGRVDGRFVDPEAAHRHDVRPTGHCHGGGQRPSNLILRAGTRSISATLADLGGIALQIDDLPDLSGLDWATGQLRARVDGVVLRGNRRVGAIRRRTLTADLGRALNQVVEVCSDTDRVGHVDAPGLVLDGFTLL